MRGILYIAILTTVIVISWIAFGVYHNNTTTTITQDKQIIITPIPPQFDEETVGKIRLRRIIEADLSSNKKIASGSSATAEETAIPTPAEELPIDFEELPTGTPSGSL
jgi:hypothetical protein